MTLPGRERSLDPDGYVYVVEFSDGVVKVGMTRDPVNRFRSLASVAKRDGVRSVRHWVSPVHRTYGRTEELMIAAAQRTGAGVAGRDEYFTGCDFDALVAAALDCDMSPTPPADRAPMPARPRTQMPGARLLADHHLGGGLDAFVAARRPDTSWRNIARDLERTTAGKVVLAPETLRGWYPDLRAKAAA